MVNSKAQVSLSRHMLIVYFTLDRMVIPVQGVVAIFTMV